MNPIFMYIVGTAIGLAVVVAAVSLIRVLGPLRRLIERLEVTAQFLETSQPKIDRILTELEAELVELRGITVKVNSIAGSAQGVATDVRHAVQPIITQVSDLAQGVRHLRAAAVAVGAGFSAWRNLRSGEGEEPIAELKLEVER
jgi:uncharacterized protein YoxC